MAYKILGQALPAAATDVTLYTAVKETVVSTIAIANQGFTTQVRVAVVKSGEALAAKHYIAYDLALNANDSNFITAGLALGVGDTIVVRAGTSNVSFNAFGAEI